MTKPNFLNVDSITPGKASASSGHVVFPQATDNDGLNIIYKANKHNNPELTQYEVAFGNLAALLAYNLTPPQRLVCGKKNELTGLAIENIGYLIGKRESLSTTKKKNFYKFTENGVSGNSESISELSGKHRAFLNELPCGFFSKLMKNVNEGQWTIDMASLAGVLATSYTLEEDDLHKGNFGCYAVEKNNKPHFVFFKIDHDMMFADALMSFGNARVNHWWRRDAAFTITSRDLIGFPYLQDSVNHYWPTTFSLGAKLNDDRAYYHSDDRKAFIGLKDNEEFKHEKWRAFYRHILIPPAEVRQKLKQGLDMSCPADRAKLNMITHAFVARQARLRAELFSISEFREFVTGLDAGSSKGDILSDIPDPDNKITRQIKRHQRICKKIAPKDSPLHVAIRLGDFRYYDSWVSVYSAYRDVANSNGEKPIDIAVQMAERRDTLPSKSIRSNPHLTANFLLYKGAKLKDKILTDKYKNYSFTLPYLKDIATLSTAEELKKVMRKIDNDYRLSLKMKKRRAVACLEEYINNYKGGNLEQVLKEFKTDLNGDPKSLKKPAAELQFIRQLRSRFWIIRKVRGLLGGTSTQVEMTDLIDKKLDKLKQKSPGCLSIFKCCDTGKAQKSAPQRSSSLVSLP